MKAIQKAESKGLTPVTPGLVARATKDWLVNIVNPRTKRSYHAGLTDFLDWLGRDLLDQPLGIDTLPGNPNEYMSARGVKKYKAWLQEQGKSRATVNHRLSVIRKWVHELEDRELIHPGRAAGIRGIKGLKGKDISFRSHLTHDEIQHVLDSIGGDKVIDIRDKALLALLSWTGLRRSEICNVKLAQYRKVNGHKIIDGIKRKGGKRDWIKIPIPLQRALERWLDAAGISEPEQWLFCSVDKGGRATGKPLTGGAIYLIVGRRCEAAGFDGITPHAFRRSFATNADLEGAPTSLIQSAGGWEGRSMVDLYVQKSASLDRNAVDFLHYEL